MSIAGFDRRDARTIWNFFKMFIRDRYLGSRLGGVWAIANPLIMLALYTYVFGFVFKSKLPGANTTLAYAAWLIAGYGPWLAISEGLNSSASSIYGNSGIVKNMAFKTECLPLAAVLVGLVPLLVSLVFLCLIVVADGNWPTWHILALIPATLATFLLVASLGLGLSALVVFSRDIGVALPSLLMMILFASPIFYPVAALPSFLRVIAAWNPFFIITEWVRQPLIFHQIPGILGLLWVYILSLTIGAFNLRAFRRVKGFLHSAI